MTPMDGVLVTVNLLTYNHCRFIAQALDSILAQRVNFRYEIVIGDDASEDGTQDIIRRYMSEYPKIIRAIFHEKNVGIARNVQSIRSLYRGKYIAPMEGDDYWIDPDKLQRQADFLEAHPEYSAVAAKLIYVDDNGQKLNLKADTKLYYEGSEYSIKEFSDYKMAGQINTMMYRSFLGSMSEEILRDYDACKAMGDRRVNLMLLQTGNIFCENKVVTAYRQHIGSWTNSCREYCMNYYLYQEMQELSEFAQKHLAVRPDFSQRKLRAWYGVVVWWICHPSKSNFRAVKEILSQSDNKTRSILYIFSHTANRIFAKKGGNNN